MPGNQKYNFLDCLPDTVSGYKGSIETFVQNELQLFSKRLEQSFLREITSPHGRQSVTTSMNRAGSAPELLSLDGFRQESKGSKSSDLSKQLISVQVREFHIVDNETNPAVLYTITSAFAGGYHATVYRMKQDIDALYKLFGRRACVAPFDVPPTNDSKRLTKSCGELRSFLLRILRCPAALGNKHLFAWFGLDRAFASSHDDEILESAFEDVWRMYYSDEKERIFSDTPEDMLTLYLTSHVKEINSSVFADVRKSGGVAAELQAIKCVMFYIRGGVRDMWDEWRATAPVLVRKFGLLPEGEFDEAVEEALAGAKKQISEAVAPFNTEAVASMKSLLTVLTPLVKSVRHTMREYRPRKQATFVTLLSLQPNDLAVYRFESLDAKLARVKSKVKGSVEFAIRTFEKELELNVKAEGGDGCPTARLLPFLRKIPTLARACFYLSQPTVMANFMKNFVLERERLSAAVPNGKAKDRSPVDVFADRMSHILTFMERDLSFSDFCVKSDFADEILQTHDRDGSLPNNNRFAFVLRTFFNMLSRFVTLKMQFFVNMTKIFVNTVNDMGLDAVVSQQLRIAMVRSASLTAYNEANSVFERHLIQRQIPEMIIDIAAALMMVPAKESIEEKIPPIVLTISRSKDPTFNAFLDVDNLIESALYAGVHAAVEPTVLEWWKTSINNREYDPVRTAQVVNKRKEAKKRAMAEEAKKKEEEKKKAAPAEEKPKKKKKGKKAKAAEEKEPEPEKKEEPEPEAEKPKKKKNKKKEAVLA